MPAGSSPAVGILREHSLIETKHCQWVEYQMKANDIEQAIRKDPGYFWIPQCRVGCGFGDDGERTVDLWGISTKRPYNHLSIEIKVSRGDFFRDVKNPLKQRRSRMMANQFWFAAPVGLLTAADLPIWGGLMEVDEFGNVRYEVPAPWFDSSPPTWSFVASIVRRFSTSDRRSCMA
jgi:hypothetical protein